MSPATAIVRHVHNVVVASLGNESYLPHMVTHVEAYQVRAGKAEFPGTSE